MNPLTLTPAQAREKIALLKGYRWVDDKERGQPTYFYAGIIPSQPALWPRSRYENNELMHRYDFVESPVALKPFRVKDAFLFVPDWIREFGYGMSLYSNLAADGWHITTESDVKTEPGDATAVILFNGADTRRGYGVGAETSDQRLLWAICAAWIAAHEETEGVVIKDA